MGKLSLDELKVQSFVTSLNADNNRTIKGGASAGPEQCVTEEPSPVCGGNDETYDTSPACCDQGTNDSSPECCEQGTDDTSPACCPGGGSTGNPCQIIC